MADFSALKTAIQANIRTNGNEEITGAILQDILLSMVTTMGDVAINALSEALLAEITNRQNAVSGEATTRAEADSQLSGRINAEAQTRDEADTQLNNSITAITTRLNEGYVYAGIATPSTNPGTPAGKVFYIALQAGTYTNFSSLTVTQGINILKYNGTAWSQEQLIAIDDKPTVGSNNLVKSGGVYNENKFMSLIPNANLINPDTITYGETINTSGLPWSGVTEDVFCVTDYIEVLGRDIICNSTAQELSYIATYAVYDKDKNLIRAINMDSHYTYVSGDVYVKIAFADNANRNIRSVFKVANFGDTLTNYEYKDSFFVSFPKLKDYTYNKKEIENKIGIFAGIYYDSEINVYIPTTGSNSKWIPTPIFYPNTLVKIVADVINPATNTCSPGFDIYLSTGLNTSSPFERIYQGPTVDPGHSVHIELYFDPAYYAVYKDPAWEQFSVWFAAVNDGTTHPEEYLKINAKVCNKYSNIEGFKTSELMVSIDNALSIENTSIEKDSETILYSQNNSKYRLIVDNNGVLSTQPFYPTKMHVFGNSLLFGMLSQFGMAASDNSHDYYHYLVSFFYQINNNFTSNKTLGTNFEGATTISNARSAISTLVNSLNGDEDLVIIQLGDNVNTTEKLNVFATSCQELIDAIKTKCANSKVVWMGLWYSSNEKYDIIKDACFNTGASFVSFEGIKGTNSNSYIGAIITVNAPTTFTIENVSSAVDDGNGNMTVVFSVSGSNYTVTVPVTSYSLDGTILTYNSNKYIVSNNGVASHPGDSGFKKIANKFLKECEYIIKDYIN